MAGKLLITPNTASVTAGQDPTIKFQGTGNSTDMTLRVTSTGALSIEGAAGQLFSVTDSMSGTIYSVNDISGIPSFEILDTGLVKIVQYSGNVVVGSATDDGTNKVQITGATKVTGPITGNSVALIGTAGAGYITLSGQSANPTSPAAGTLLVHAKTVNGFTRMEQDNEAVTNVVYGRDSVFVAQNPTGVTIAKGAAVYVSGTVSGAPQVQPAQANLATTIPCVGIALDAIAGSAYGQILVSGLITFDTTAFSTGVDVWVSATVAGGLTATRPSGTNFVQRIGTVLVSGNATTGLMFVQTSPAVLNMETGTNAAAWTAQGNISVAGTITQTGGNNTFAGRLTAPTFYSTTTGSAAFSALTYGTIQKYLEIGNGQAQIMQIGYESSAGGTLVTGAGSYEGVIQSVTPLTIGINYAKIGKFSSTGFDVTGTLSASGTVTASNFTGSSSGTNTGDQTGGTPAIVFGTANTAGTSTNFLRRDDTIAIFDATIPVVAGTAATGSAAVAARRDHVHPAQTTISGNAASATRISFSDRRAIVQTPSYFGAGADWSFMQNSTDGLSDGGTYHGVMHYQPYSDASGGGAYEVGFTDNNNMWLRGSSGALTTWGAWKKILDTTNAFDATVPVAVDSSAAGTGSATVAARRDHKHTIATLNGTTSGIVTAQGSGTTTVYLNGNGAWSTPTGAPWLRKTTTYTAVAGDLLIADTSGGAFTITLPATPATGASVTIADGAAWKTANLTVARNGSTIEGLSEDLVLDISNIQVQFVYNTTSWQVYTFAAPAVAAAVGGGTDQVFFENGTQVMSNYTITSGKNAMCAGPIAVNTGVTVTVPTGSVWTIV